MKVFVSYSSKDKDVIESVMPTIVSMVGKDNIIFDEFCLKPGDSIIDFMNNALESYSHFLFFVSKNSLDSFMCGLEWKNALILVKQKDRFFIPVIIDDCQIPSILLDTKHINPYCDGIDKFDKQLRFLLFDYQEPIEDNTKSNLYAIAFIASNSIDIEIGCNFWSEPNSSFCIATGLNERVKFNGQDFEPFNGSTQILPLDGIDRDCIFIRPFRPLTPNNPFKISFCTNNLSYLMIMQVDGSKGVPIETRVYKKTINILLFNV